jgi:hypothetical protein
MAVSAQMQRIQPHTSLFGSTRRQGFASPGCLGQPALDPAPSLLARANDGSAFGEHTRVHFGERRGLIGHRVRVRLYDDRLELLLGATLLMTLQRGRSGASGKHGHVVDYHHVIHALRRKPMALLSLVYRDQLFPREAYRLMFEFLRQELPERAACKLMVALLSLAHDRSCEAQLAGVLADDLEQRRLPDIHALLARFAPDPARLPQHAATSRAACIRTS